MNCLHLVGALVVAGLMCACVETTGTSPLGSLLESELQRSLGLEAPAAGSGQVPLVGTVSDA